MADLLSAISVLLVFLTFLFNAVDKQVSEKVDQVKPDEQQKKKRKRFNFELRQLLWLKVSPIMLIYLVAAYTLSFRAFRIVIGSKFSLYHFDELNTIFVFIVVGLWGLTTYAVLKTFQIIKKLYE